MSNNIYFISIIGRALEQPNAQAALREAFRKILTMGREPAYAKGFIQFREFMRHVNESMNADLGSVESMRNLRSTQLALELATETFQGNETESQAALDVIMSQPEARRIYTDLSEALRKSSPPASRIELVLEKEGEVVAAISIDSLPGLAQVGNVSPGPYRLRSAGGRILWEDALHEDDLVWARAYPGRPLELAADSGDSVPTRPTREIALLGGELVVRTFPGIESGYIEIELRTAGETE